MPSRWSERRKRFRTLMSGNRCVHPASVHDAISARIAADLGFEMGMFAGSVASLAVLGAPDIIALTLTEFADQAYRIGRAADLALLVDADHGYGNALNVMRTVEELESAGVAGLSIEDTLLPQSFGGGKAPQLISIEEGVGKMGAALRARRDPDLVIAGRTSAIGITGIDDAVRRVKAYEAAGVDALFLVGVKTHEQLDAVASAVGLPLIIGSVGKGLMDLDELAQRRVRVCLQGHQPFQAAVRAVHETLRALRQGVAPAELTNLASGDLMRQVTRAADYEHWSREFLGT
ncbi:MAG: isocitrate lyase/PEP mutase family protein [Hyphomicrobiaceae bacterium]|nr:MAG: isocitrate lyase/PEP mutase family protein [Hyphomicrobiaceae bacterium]